MRDLVLRPLVCGLLLHGCCAEPGQVPPSTRPALSGEASASAAPSASAPPEAPSEPVRRAAPLPKPSEITVATKDTTKLMVDVYEQPEGEAKVLVLLHRLAGSRPDWAPLLKLLGERGVKAHVVVPDLRGHGHSTGRGDKKTQVLWPVLSKKDFEALGDDVLSVIEAVDKRLGPRATGYVLVGSDIGATAAVLAASKQPRVEALALVSPGAELKGVRIYKPFAQVRTRPSYLAGAEADTVSVEPINAMSSMRDVKATVKRYPGQAHGLVFLGREHPQAYDDLVEWLAGRVGPG